MGKQPRKKPKDSGVAAQDGLPAVQAQGAGGPGGGGGGVPRASLPNYMRATSSSGARAGRAVAREAAPAAPPPPKPKRESVRAKVVFAAAPRAGRATCSSTMKAPGAGAAHVCPYAYCSLKGHVHASVVPLKSFVASQRRLIKTQQSMKLKGASPFRKAGNGGGGDGYFVEILAGPGASAPTVSSDVSCSDLSTEEMDAMVRRMEYVTFDHLSSVDDAEDEAKDSGGSCGSSVVISDASVELLGNKHRGLQEKGTLVDHEDEDFGACKSDISEELNAKHDGNSSHDCGGDASNESSVDGISSALSGISFEDVSSYCADAESSQGKKLTISRRRRTAEECVEQVRPFKPKAPNFLPVETGPEAEKVNLRHQMMNDQKNAEEWMVDYALRKAVKKLARAQKRKVEMLVQAFEAVLPTVAEKPVQQDDDKKNVPLSRPLQACGQ
ncbi:hypothetical protein ACP70R_038973 [Stipagrostis hirtigluma subsp. patula]